MSHEKTCFVIIGYGRRTDPFTGRSIDLDRTFDDLIQPACDAAGLNAFRAIDANLTGSINTLMYRWIQQADVVIADLTTLSANVFYELGVRHALRPTTTILLGEKELINKIPFDLSSYVVNAYQHPDGADDPGPISDADVTKLKGVIKGALDKLEREPGIDKSDSPVFDVLPGMPPPVPPEKLGKLSPPDWIEPEQRPAARQAKRYLSDVIALAKEEEQKENYSAAIALYQEAIKLCGGEKDVLLYQRYADLTYQLADEMAAGGEAATKTLLKAERILEEHCALGITSDPQTLVIAGNIRRRLFELSRRSQRLPWPSYPWKWIRDLWRKFVFSLREQEHFHDALDYYDRAWTSSEQETYAKKKTEMLLVIARSTWAPWLRARFYAEARTSRRRSNSREGGRLVACTLFSLFFLWLSAGVLGVGATWYYLSPFRVVPTPIPPCPDCEPVLGDVFISAVDLESILARLRQIDQTTESTATTVGELTESEDTQAESILELVQRIDGTTKSTKKSVSTTQLTVNSIRATVGDIATTPPNDRQDILNIVRNMRPAVTTIRTTLGDLTLSWNRRLEVGPTNIVNALAIILNELQNPGPSTRSSGGPALQFAGLENVLKGFVYDVAPPNPLRIEELGLELVVEVVDLPDPEGAHARLTVSDVDGSNVFYPPLDADSPQRGEPQLLTILSKGRDTGWDPDWVNRRVADDSRVAEFAEFEDNAGFWYAVTVNRDDVGLYAVVRRCAQRCQ